jgi:hypothetical protein
MKVSEQTATAAEVWAEISTDAMVSEAVVANVAAKLERLCTYLQPMALFWLRPRPSKPVIKVLLLKFWFGGGNHGGAKGDRELCGRKMGEHCRGELLRDVARRMAPWWKPGADS